MNNKRKRIVILTLVTVLAAGILSGCGRKKLEEVTIVYTNDVHSYIFNEIDDSQGNYSKDGLRLSKVCAMVKDMRSEGKNVILADAGDEFQGDVFGAIDQGESILELMNATGYQVASPGNHDFDYGVIQMLKLRDEAEYPYISCNFHSTSSKEIVFPDSKIFDFNGTRVAFIGITTPETLTSTTPVYFQNEKGEYIYTIDGIKAPEDMYTSVQNAIDNVKDKADYIIALGHIGCGMDEVKNKISSIDIIENTTGLNAFIDGHSHTTVEGDIHKDKEGKDVLLTQTGSYLSHFGLMTIDENGNITSKLVDDYDKEDETVAELEKKVDQKVSDHFNEKIGSLDKDIYVNNPNDSNQRLIRAMEMNSGDITADSIYWYFNERVGQECDVAIQNSGGIRSGIDQGEITYMSVKTVEPYGNMICLISATGQQIVDALEMGASLVGTWDDEWNTPAENGGFLQVAGLTYTIDAGVSSSVETDENGMFKDVKGDYRVKDVKIYNKQTGNFEPIQLSKIYSVGGINYLLRNSGDGLSMFADDDLIIDYVGQDYMIFAEYLKSFDLAGNYSRVNTKNSPLSAYEGYLIDYENPFGSGRITIKNTDYPEGKLNLD